tara:strand:+ start:62 stop:1348 length:1287 start_codon:yes stop_codon:yes gene_type:complete
MKLLDLFSGIGGFSLGAEYNNIKTVGFVEKDVFCQKVLKKHWPTVKIIEDIRNVTKDTFEPVDIVSGGFPCQPFSVAGKRRGTDDDRYLWDETIRVVSLYKPRWFVGENVEGIINIQNGMVLRQVQDDLEKEGFQVQCFVIPASGIGAWHQRKRVWIVGNSQHNESPTTQEQRGNTQTAAGSQKRENSSLQSERTSRPTDNGDVSNSHDSRNRTSRYGSQREGEKNAKEGQNRLQFESSRHSKNDVSNSHANLRRRRGAILQSGKNKIWGFYNEKSEQTSHDLRSETIRCDVVSGEKEDVSNSQNRSREQTQWQGRESTGRGSDDRSRVEREGKKIKTDVSDYSTKRLQRHNSEQQLSKEKLRFSASKDDERKQSWWEIESSVCTVPNGVSYELDKNRVNQIKSLGNSIVPQIAYQIFYAIISAEGKN